MVNKNKVLQAGMMKLACEMESYAEVVTKAFHIGNFE